MRLLAWRAVPRVAGGQVDIVAPVDCERDCYARKQRRWKVSVRRERACSRVDLPLVELRPKPGPLAAWYGLPEDEDFDATTWAGTRRHGLAPDRWKNPPEPLQDGCPEGWARSPFAVSVLPYVRRRDTQGNRVANPRLDRCEDRLVVDAVLYFEAEQEALVSHRDELQSKLWEASRGKHS